MRIIPRIDIKNNYVIKGINLEGLRKIGDPKEIIENYSNENADEILIMDSVASLYGRNNLFELIKEITKEIFIMGKIRSGRSSQIKKKLAEKIRDRIFKYLNIKRENIWIYIIDIPPDQMIEYGEVLPKSGQEKRWFNSLSPSLKKRLNVFIISLIIFCALAAFFIKV